MSRVTFAVVLLMTGTLLVGCKKDKPAAPAANGSASSMTDSAVATAQKYYDQAVEMINKKDFAGAQEMINKLDSMSSALPAEWQGKITSLKSMLNTAKGIMPAAK